MRSTVSFKLLFSAAAICAVPLALAIPDHEARATAATSAPTDGAANPFASPGEAGVGVGWAAYPPSAVGHGVELEDGALKFSNPSPDQNIRVCTAKRPNAPPRVRVSGRWKREGIVSRLDWQGALLELVAFDEKGARIENADWSGAILMGQGTADWEDFQYNYVLPKGAKQVRLCTELRGSSEGTLWFSELQLTDTAATSPGNGKNVLWVVVDALRSDMLGVYGQKQPLSPNIDRFAQGAWVADHAWTQYTWTTPSFVSYMLSQHARTHGYNYDTSETAKNIHMLGDAVPTLAEILAENGYVTAGVSANARIRPELGVTRGFEHWMLPGWDQQVVDRAIEDIGAWAGDGAPNFFYAHLMTTHVGLFPTPEAQKVAGVSVQVPDKVGITYWESSAPENQAKDQATHDKMFQDAYTACVYDADRYFQQILDALEASGLADDTVVVFSSDHGELLGEHGEMGHGNFVWEPLTGVPLIVRMPGKGATHIDDRVAELIDVSPTVLEYVGLGDQIPEAWQGRSLMRAPSRAGAVSERLNLVSFTNDGRYKVIETHEGGTVQRAGFDLKKDPGELHAVEGGENYQPVLDYAQTWYATVPEGRNEGGAVKTSPEDEEKELEMLRRLGYVE